MSLLGVETRISLLQKSARDTNRENTKGPRRDTKERNDLVRVFTLVLSLSKDEQGVLQR